MRVAQGIALIHAAHATIVATIYGDVRSSRPGAYCITLVPENFCSSYGKVNGKIMLTRVFRFY